MSGYTIIDADTHVTESADLWTSRALARPRGTYRERCRWEPKVGGRRKPAPGYCRYDRNRRRGNFQQPAQDFRGDASGRIQRQGALEVHGPNGHLGDGHVPERRRVWGPAIFETE